MTPKKRLFVSLTIFIAVILMGVAGFKIIGGKEWSLLDSLYMTVITVATVGYEEVVDLSQNSAARIFTIIYIIICLGTIAFAVSSVTAFVVEGELKNILGRRKMEKEIAKLKDHYIVCGSDETAQTIIQELILTKRDFVVIEPAKEKIDKLSSLGSFPYIQGDPAEDSVLLQAGIERAKGIFPSLPTDEVNLFVTITARSLNSNLKIVAKGIDIKSHDKMKKAGADYVVSPTYIGGMRMVSEMIRPAAVTFLDMMLRDREHVLRVEEFPVEKGSPLIGKSVGETKIGEKTGALLVALRKGETKDYDFNPAPEVRVKENDVLVLIAGPEMIEKLTKVAREG
jgi:voltage-gated potassium channel